MKFKIKYVFPVILVVLALISVVFLPEIEPFNFVVALIVFVIAAVMVWRIYYDLSSVPKKQETEYVPSSNVSELLKDSPKDSKIKLDDFLKSSPKDLSSKDFGKEFDFSGSSEEPKEIDPFSEEALEQQKYNEMKKKVLKELRDVVKPKKIKKDVLK
jgi:uncharacterized membrane protein YraQ (UPF0718 family)